MYLAGSANPGVTFGVSRGTAAELGTSCAQLGFACGLVNRPVHASAGPQVLVGCVDDRVHPFASDVAEDDRDARRGETLFDHCYDDSPILRRLTATSIASVPLVALFTVLTLALAGVAVASATAGEWIIAACAAVLAGWLASLARSSLRRTRQ